MNSQRKQLTVSLMLSIALAVPAGSSAQELETVLEWNRILQTTVASTPTVFHTRPYAMTSIAVFDALNSIDRVYHAFFAQVNAPAGASRDAAVAQAAHDVLVALYPGQKTALDTALATTLARLPSEAAAAGAKVGANAATACLSARTGDGWERTPPYPEVTGFIIEHRLQFLMEAPPALTPARHAADSNEVKALGPATGSTCTAEQTSIARRWAGIDTSTPAQMVWNNVVRDLVRRSGWSALDAARAFALLNAGQHDAFLTSFTGRFLYGLWRPVTAIREAAGNMACVAAVSARVLERIFGRDDIPLTVTWTGTGGAADITRSFGGFRHLANESSESRIDGGIHHRFDQLPNFGVCTQLADYAADNYLRRIFPAQ